MKDTFAKAKKVRNVHFILFYGLSQNQQEARGFNESSEHPLADQLGTATATL